MMMSLSPPGLPSEFSLRMEFASCESFAIPRVAAPAIKPRAERAEPNRMAKVLRVEVKFICMLLSIDNLEFVVRGKAKSNTSIPAAMATSRFPAKVRVMGDGRFANQG